MTLPGTVNPSFGDEPVTRRESLRDLSGTHPVGTAIPPQSRVIGRYLLGDVIASGGMASVHLGRLLGPVGFTRTVAIKRLHEVYAGDPAFVAMLLDEARVAARVRHPHVVSVLDVVAQERELFLVMDYIEGESLSDLLTAMRRRDERIPLRVASAILGGMLAGLHAAHEVRDERGAPLQIVHRDVSPQNILVGVDGCARVVDFGIAKAIGRAHETGNGQIKGKLAYMPPEQIGAGSVDRRADIYAACVVLWEVVVGRRLFSSDESDAEIKRRVLEGIFPPPSSLVRGLPAGIDDVVARGLARKREDRFDSAIELAEAIERCLPQATEREVAAWVASVAAPRLRARGELVASAERSWGEKGLAGPEDEAVVRPDADAAPPNDERPPAEKRFGTLPSTASAVPRSRSIFGHPRLPTNRKRGAPNPRPPVVASERRIQPRTVRPRRRLAWALVLAAVALASLALAAMYRDRPANAGAPPVVPEQKWDADVARGSGHH